MEEIWTILHYEYWAQSAFLILVNIDHNKLIQSPFLVFLLAIAWSIRGKNVCIHQLGKFISHSMWSLMNLSFLIPRLQACTRVILLRGSFASSQNGRLIYQMILLHLTLHYFQPLHRLNLKISLANYTIKCITIPPQLSLLQWPYQALLCLSHVKHLTQIHQ